MRTQWEPSVLLSQNRPTLLAYFEELRNRIEQSFPRQSRTKSFLRSKPDKWDCVQAPQLWNAHICTETTEENRVIEREKQRERERKTKKE